MMPWPSAAFRGISVGGFRRPPLLSVLGGGAPSGLVGLGVLSGNKGEVVTFTRTGAKFVQNAAGTLLSVATGLPGVDYRGLSCEAAHTNLVLQSQTFDNGTWSAQSSGAVPTIAANAAIAPDGTMTADVITYNTAVPPGGWSDLRQAVTISPGAYVFSVWLMAGTTAATNLIAGVSGGTGSTAVGVALSTQWQFFTLPFTAGAGASAVSVRLGNDGSGIVTQAVGSLVAWGAQLETGAYAHSYVPTVGASVTLNADQATTPTTALPVAAGAVECVFTPLFSTATALPAHAVLVDSGAGGTGGVTLDIASGALVATVGGGSATSAVLTWVAGQAYRIRVVWDSGAGTVQIWRDFVLVKNQTGLTPTVVHNASLGIGSSSGGGTLPAEGYISDLRFFTV